ncbi:hypothetical protein Asi02nite_32250 [Asanoa siamensis]|uniref:Uncharacterized protein n=1 Tax=Asanoa siamensis TaxID=926357 RepID=A0ABQ4CR21_9ACTN|nr:hypothetical protein Asi02nite_32250 [Asanoa siamensis]
MRRGGRRLGRGSAATGFGARPPCVAAPAAKGAAAPQPGWGWARGLGTADTVPLWDVAGLVGHMVTTLARAARQPD